MAGPAPAPYAPVGSTDFSADLGTWRAPGRADVQVVVTGDRRLASFYVQKAAARTPPLVDTRLGHPVFRVSLLVPAAPVAKMGITALTGGVPLTVTVCDFSTGSVTSRDFNWGDGTAHGTTTPCSHTYTTAGSYTISLVATGPGGASAPCTCVVTAATGASGVPDVVDVWLASIATHGGAVPSSGTVTALRAFAAGLLSDGLFNAMLAVNCCVPDSLQACITPLIYARGFSPWTGVNLVSGDVTANGVAGNGSTKYLNTGFSPSVDFPSNLNCGASCYAYSVGGNGFSLGSYTGTGLSVWAAKYTGAISTSYIGAAGNLVSVASPGAGYYSFNRVSSTSHKVFFAKSSSAHAQIGATDALADSTALYSGAVYALGSNFNGALNGASTDRLSFIALHRGLSAAESALLYARVQALRTGLGGGYV